MAHIYRPAVVKPIPKSATVHTAKGGKVARWTARGGKKMEAPLTECGKKCRVLSPTWWIEYTGPTGDRERVKGHRSREATQHLAARLEQEAEAVRSGRAPASARPTGHMIDYLDPYREHVEQTTSHPRHQYEAVANVREVLVGLGLTTPGAVDPERVMAWLSIEARSKKRGTGKTGEKTGWSARTLAHRIRKLKAFGNWMVESRRAAYNPFAALKPPPNLRTDRRRIRRALDHLELLRLVACARVSTLVVMGLDGPARAALYLTAAFTGFRAGALARLTPASIEWGEDIPILLYSGKNKNGKPHCVPVQTEIARELADWLRARPAGRPLFDGVPTWRLWTARLLRVDLEAAGIPYTDAEGEVYDFHSLRGQFATRLAQDGVPVAAAVELMDHSDPKLTLITYGRYGPGQLVAEIAKLRGLS